MPVLAARGTAGAPMAPARELDIHGDEGGAGEATGGAHRGKERELPDVVEEDLAIGGDLVVVEAKIALGAEARRGEAARVVAPLHLQPQRATHRGA
jgi:hypothetical protein